MKKNDRQRQSLSLKSKEGYAIAGSAKFFATLKSALKYAKDNGLDPKSYYRTAQ